MSERATARPFVVVGELLLSDGAHYTHYVMYEAVIVREWREEQYHRS